MPAVTSLQVAEAFGKKHFHVLRDIREIMLKCSESFNTSNFGFSTTKDAKGEERPMRLLSKDGLLNVLRDIADLLSQTPEIFIEPNLGEYEAEYRAGFGMKKTPAYLLSKDGFTLLTMGYTGERAMRFKVAYIQRFNEMEAELARRFPCLQGGKPAPLIPQKDGGARRGGRFGKVKHRKR